MVKIDNKKADISQLFYTFKTFQAIFLAIQDA